MTTCTVHSGAKKTHDWVVQQLVDLFRTTHKVKAERVVRSRGQRCGDIELASCLVNETGPVSTFSLHVIPRYSPVTPGRPVLYTTTHALFPVLISTSHTSTCVQGIQKKLGSSCVIYRFVFILQHKTAKPTSKQIVKQSHF